jgi:transcription-repair coupling factor (superfamily II helicase)
MFLYFVDETNVAYYQSPMFGRILRYIQDNPRRCKIRQRADKRSVAIAHVDTVEEGVNVLQTILALPAL